MREKLLILRNFLYRLFLVGFVLTVFAQIFYTIVLSSPYLEDAMMLANIPLSYFQQLLTSCLTFARLFFAYAVLCPALALHWTIAKDKNLNK